MAEPSTSTTVSSSLPTTSHTAHQGKGRKRPHHNGNNNWESRRGRPRRHFKNHHQRHHNNNHKRGAPPGAKKQDTSPPSCSVCKLVSTDKVCANKYKCPKCREPYCSVACYKRHKEVCTAAAEAKQATESSSTAASLADNSGPKSKYLLSRDGDNTIVEDPLGLVAKHQKQHGNAGGKGQARQQLEESDDDSLDEGWKITDSMKTTLDKSNWLHSELGDGGLRQIIHKIVHSSNTIQENGRTRQEEELELAKASYPNFELFMDKLLVLSGVLERQRTMLEGGDDGGGTSGTGGGRGVIAGGGNDTVDNANEEELEEWLKQDHTYEELQQMLVLKPLERKVRPKMTESIERSSSSGSASSSEEESSSDDDDDDEDGSDETDSSGDE